MQMDGGPSKISNLTLSSSCTVANSPAKLQNQLTPSKSKVEAYVRSAIRSWEETGCTLVPIYWVNEKRGESFLSIFGCCWKFMVHLKTISDTASLEAAASSIVEQVGAGNIARCIVDDSVRSNNFSNNILHTRFPPMKCAAHRLQLLFERICQEVVWVRETLDIINSVVGYIYSQDDMLELMRKHTKGKELKHSSGFDCMSNYKALQSMLEAKPDLLRLVRSDEWLQFCCEEGQFGDTLMSHIQNPKVWEQLEMVNSALTSLSQVYGFVDSHGSSISGYVYGLMDIVEDSVTRLANSNSDTFQAVLDIFREEKRNIIGHFDGMAAYLTPAYICSKRGKRAAKNSFSNYILKNFIKESDRENFFKETNAYYRMLSKRSSSESPVAKTFNPCEWWDWFGRELVIFRGLAVKVLSQPCSTGSCKRILQQMGVEQMGVVGSDFDLKLNGVLMEMMESPEAEAFKIDLDEFSESQHAIQQPAHGTLKQSKLFFGTDIAEVIYTKEYVVGVNGCPIQVRLVDVATSEVVQDETLSTLPLTILALVVPSSNEASSEHDNKGPYISGDLGVPLIAGEGTLGEFSFNCKGCFKLAVKPPTSCHEGDFILVGMSNTFIVLDAPETSTYDAGAHVDQLNGSSSSNHGQKFFDNQSTEGEEVPKPRRAVYSSGSDSVTQQNDGNEVNGEAVELKGIDYLSSVSAMGLFGVPSSSSAKPVGETNEPVGLTHVSTALQLSFRGDGVVEPQEVQLASANEVNQQTATARAMPTTKDSMEMMPTTEDSMEITYIGVRKRPLGCYDAEIQDLKKKSPMSSE